MKDKCNIAPHIAMLFYVVFACILLTSPVYAAAGTLYESEPNNTYSTSDVTYNDYDNYGYISTSTDEDWWRVRFNYSGSAKGGISLKKAKLFFISQKKAKLFSS